MPDFSRIIDLAYTRILERPADPGGLESYNSLMNGGMTEASMRESLLRSPEYAIKNPDRAAARASSRARKKTKKKTRTKKRRKTAKRSR